MTHASAVIMYLAYLTNRRRPPLPWLERGACAAYLGAPQMSDDLNRYPVFAARRKDGRFWTKKAAWSVDPGEAQLLADASSQECCIRLEFTRDLDAADAIAYAIVRASKDRVEFMNLELSRWVLEPTHVSLIPFLESAQKTATGRCGGHNVFVAGVVAVSP